MEINTGVIWYLLSDKALCRKTLHIPMGIYRGK
jgi:hypothetical protein